MKLRSSGDQVDTLPLPPFRCGRAMAKPEESSDTQLPLSSVDEARPAGADVNCFGKGPIKSVKFFTGTGSVDPYDWTEEFARISMVNNWPAAAASRYFLAHLTEAAGRWAVHAGYMSAKRAPLPSVEELSKALIERFGQDPRTRARELRKKAQSRTQGRHETVASYASDLQDLATRAGIPSDSLLDLFITGLRDDIRVHLDSGPRIESLHDAVDIARRRESALQDVGRGKRASVAAIQHLQDSDSEEAPSAEPQAASSHGPCACSATNSSPALTSELESLRTTVAALQSSFSSLSQVLAATSQAAPRRREPPGPCPICREHGHWRSECPKRSGPVGGGGFGGRTDSKCHRCGEPGHFARDCTAPAPLPRSGNGQLRR